MRYFNTEGVCSPDKHYMVRLDERLDKIKRLYVDRGKYFVINRGRQYGKTTTLRALAEYLRDDYVVLSMDFQGISTAEFKDEATFSKAFVKAVAKAFGKMDMEDKERMLELVTSLSDRSEDLTMGELFERLSGLCEMSAKPVVLIIDEVDSASNNQVFIDFLAMLRENYLDRENRLTFHSVILAGVYDIKNLKLKIRPDSEHKYNSPWNIAAEFKVNMNFSADQIAGMLREYEADSQTGMDCGAMAEEIFQYTSGYPYLVSAICKFLDEDLPDNGTFADKAKVWSGEGITEAVKDILNRKAPLFGSMIRQLAENDDIKQMLYAILFRGDQIAYNPDTHAIDLAQMFGYIVNQNGIVQIANRIFEMRLYNFFLSEVELGNVMCGKARENKSQFIKNGRLDMGLVLEKFVSHYTDIYGDNDEKFVEEYGRKFFLLYLKPIINGVGNYYVEAQTRDARRADVVVDYRGEQFVVELKIWHGNEYNERGEEQLAEYLDYFHQTKGYMLSFNFNKNKQAGIKTIELNGRTVVEAVV